MKGKSKLTKVQEKWVSGILIRIRGGLRRDVPEPFEEPVHLFNPEVVNVKEK